MQVRFCRINSYRINFLNFLFILCKYYDVNVQKQKRIQRKIRNFRNLLYFLEQLVESEVSSFFFTVFSCFNCFQLQFSSNISIDLLQYSNFQASKLCIGTLFRGPGSQVPFENFGVTGPGSQEGPVSHLIILGSWVSGPTEGVPGLGSHQGVPGLRSHFSGMPFWEVSL